MACLGLVRLLGNGGDRDPRDAAPGGRLNAGRRRDSGLHDGVAVAGLVHLPDPRVSVPGRALELDGEFDLSRGRSRAETLVLEVEDGDADPVGCCQHDRLVGRGEPGVVPGIGEDRVDDGSGERAGRGEPDAGAVGAVDEHPDADTGGGC